MAETMEISSNATFLSFTRILHALASMHTHTHTHTHTHARTHTHTNKHKQTNKQHTYLIIINNKNNNAVAGDTKHHSGTMFQPTKTCNIKNPA